MYPLTDWTYARRCDRLDRLDELEFYEELVVASAQLVERIIKRHLIREVNRQGGRVGYPQESDGGYPDGEGPRQPGTAMG